MSNIINASTSSGLVQTADTSGTIDFQSSGATKLTVSTSGTSIAQYTPATSLITSDTVKASTSGTSIEFTGIPSWVKRITVMFAGVSTNGTSVPLIQLGDSGGIENTGYLGTGTSLGTSVVSFTNGFAITSASSAASVYHGLVTISMLSDSTNTWCASGSMSRTDVAVANFTSGSKALSATLDRIRITTVNGTDTFDAGSINILYE
jgi:hypothetical protein